MDPIEAINRHLSVAARERQDGTRAAKRGVLPFITISRESGAGGQTLARAILEAFESRKGEPIFKGWKVFDRELCELVANDPDLNVSLRSLLDESSLNAVEDVVSVMLGVSHQRDVHRKVAETVRGLAMVGKAIIVGRGGECVTRDLRAGLHLRLVAPLSIRIERESRKHGSDIGDVEKWVRERDRNRASFVERVYNQKIDDPMLYDVTWNTERIPLDLVVQSVLRWADQTQPG